MVIPWRKLLQRKNSGGKLHWREKKRLNGSW